MAEQDVDDGSAGGADADGLSARIEAFPWPAGLAAGCGAFVAGYLVIAGYVLVGIAPLQGGVTDKLLGIGYIFYNTHTIPIVSTLPDSVNPLAHPVANAAIPWLYYGVPVVALVAAGGVFTYWYRPPEQDAFVAVATGAAMTIGYLLFALVGSVLYGRIEPLQPAQLQTLVYGTAYPLVCGTLGSIVAQASLESGRAGGKETDEAETG